MATTSIHHQWTYDVFVSFRGEDIRKSFIDHLFNDFKQRGIIAFRDDAQLPKGEAISSQLYRAIENSRFLVVIFSKHYASSSWCLRELVKILECKQIANHNYQVQVVFYDVKPDVVRHQTGSYAEAFIKHESLKKKEVVRWKEALTMAADLSGWDLQDMANGYESKFINMITDYILQKLCDGTLHVGENLVGVAARVNKMNLSRFIGSIKVHMIGICGIGGIGKTTLAKYIFNMMHVHFEACSFCDDVQGVAKQHGLVQVLVQLIDDVIKSSDLTIRSVGQGTRVMKERLAAKRVLIVLDGVDKREQLEALVGSCSWFFPGSLIVITSKDKQLLNAHGVDEIYDVDFLNRDEAFKLFSLYAFREEQPTQDFEKCAYQVVRYMEGHPLALKVMGGFLYHKTYCEWKSELDRLQLYPHPEIQEVLRLSFDGLDHDQQSIFLDIACCFEGENKDLATNVLNGCNFFADTNIRVLIDKSLITISSTMSLKMHDLIRRMAWKIVCDESKRPGERSRLWIPEEVCDVLKNYKVTDTIEVLVLPLNKCSQKVQINGKAFAKMNKLRILKVCYFELPEIGDTFELMQANDVEVEFSGSFDFLSNELRMLYWHGYPLKFLPSSFCPKNIVVIDMSYSNIQVLWRTPKRFENLRVVKLRHCCHLTKTPDFTEIENLEELILEGCINLVAVHPSVGNLKRLTVLNLRNCRSLVNFPRNIATESLEVLIISGCSKVDKLPEALGNIKTLMELRADQTAIKEIPYFVSSLCNLRVLAIGGRGEIQYGWKTSNFWPPPFLRKLQHPMSSVLPSLAGLRLLTELDLSHCNISEVSPDSIGGLSFLDSLNLSGNNFSSLPASLSELPKLGILRLIGCMKLEVLPKLPPNIIRVFASNCMSLRGLQTQRITGNEVFMDFTNCPKLVEHQTIGSMVPLFLPQGPNFSSFEIILEGSRIPRWFTHQSCGNSVKVKLPPYWCYDKFITCGICLVFTVKDKFCWEFKGSLTCDDGVTLFSPSVTYLGLMYHKGMNIGSNMMFCFGSRFRLRSKDANTVITFAFTSAGDVDEVKKCGVRLVFVDIPERDGLSLIEGIQPPMSTQDDALCDFRYSITWKIASPCD